MMSTTDLRMCSKVHSQFIRDEVQMITEARARTRLAEAMDGRRVALRMQWGAVAAEADMSTAHLRRIRNNETPLSPLMKVGLETALKWAPGSIDRILEGGAPVELGEPVDVNVQGTSGSVRVRGGQGSVQTGDGLQAAIRELARRLPPEDVRALLEEFTESGHAEDNPYTDAAERKVWEIVELPGTIREHLVVYMRGLRAAAEFSTPARVSQAEASRPSAEVREFRQQG